MKLFLLFSVVFALMTGCSNSDENLARRADKIHASIMTIDTHCDTPMEFANGTFDLGKRHDEGCVDFPRMNEGGLHGEFFAVFIAQGPRNDSTFDKVHKETLKILTCHT